MKERIPNLPSVLTKYDPEFGQVKSNNNSPQTELTGSRKPQCTKENKDTKGTKPESVQQGVSVKANQRDVSVKASVPEDRANTPRTKSAKKRSQEEGKRLEQVAELWDRVRSDFVQERQELLEEKIRLQQQLIRAQDQRAHARRQHECTAQSRKRSEERQAKKNTASALQNKGRKSGSGSDKTPSQKTEAPPPPPAQDDPSEEAPSSPSEGSRAKGRHQHSGYLPSDSYAPATSPMKELLAEEEEPEQEERKPRAPDGVVTPADLSAVPWHHAQLYKMYGRHADYYIHPKMQPEKKKIVNPTLKSQKGHLGASHIWTTLRKDSMNKLYKTDRRFPQELKSAFSAHVREGITNHKEPVFRNFTETDDVPDLNRLMDQSLLRRIRVLRHKTELMYRSSQTNNDRTKVLLFNSPLPAVSEGEEGIDRYLPSWDTLDDTASEPSYSRWLKPQPPSDPNDDPQVSGEVSQSTEGRARRAHPPSVLSPLGSEFSDSLHSVWDSVMKRQKPRPLPRYHFLTEAEARSHGAFLEKLGLDKTKLDQGRVDLLPPDHHFHGGLATDRGGSNPDSPLKALSAPQSRSSRHSVAVPAASGESYTSPWQPLSLQALVEYKDQVASTHGVGDYHQGRPHMWPTRLAASSGE